MALISMKQLEFENFDFLPPVSLNVIQKISCSSISMKIGEMNN